MRPVVALAVGVTALWAQTGRPAPHSVTAVRHWSLGSVTRIAVEVSGEFEYRSDRLHNPDRIYYDILNARRISITSASIRKIRTTHWLSVSASPRPPRE